MEPQTKSKPENATSFNKAAYAVFIIAAIYFMFRRDISQAVIFWSLALVFDPFDITIPFGKRPMYQRIWLVVHTVIAFVLFGLLLTYF